MKRHYIVRGICIAQDSVLLAQDIGASNTFLPGGHIEPGENAMDALEREVLEELGVASQAKEFLGVVENLYESSGSRHHEVNLVFRITSVSLTNSEVDPESKESHLRFFWCRLDQLESQNLLPQPMAGFFQDPPLTWASTISRKENEYDA